MKNKIIDLRRKGYSYNKIVKILGCSKSTVSYHCKNLVVNQYLNSDTIKDIKDLRKKGFTYNKISDTLKIPYEKVSFICKKNNLNDFLFKIDSDKIEQIRKLYLELYSTRKVAVKLNIARHSVIKYVNDLIKTKQKSLTPIKKSKTGVHKVVSWRQRTKKKLVEYKGGECCRCGYSKCIWALEFHHVNPTEKDFVVTGKSWSFERLKNEVDKCILLCSNCHQEEHYNLKYGKVN